MKRVQQFLCDDQGATAVEYAVLLFLILLVLLGSVALFGERTHGMWSSIQTNLNETSVLK